MTSTRTWQQGRLPIEVNCIVGLEGSEREGFLTEGEFARVVDVDGAEEACHAEVSHSQGRSQDAGQLTLRQRPVLLRLEHLRSHTHTHTPSLSDLEDSTPMDDPHRL